MRTEVRMANDRDYIMKTELTALCDRYNEIEKMLTGLIRHLEKRTAGIGG